jgi:hypothetical protein
MPVLNMYHHGKKVPDGAINIKRGSIFGNPFEIGKHGTREEVIEMFRVDLWKRMRQDKVFAKQVLELHEKNVCCCCFPKACHGDVLLSAAKWLSEHPEFFK